MGWQSVDARSHPDDEWINGDPAEIPSPGDLLAELARRPAWHDRAACRGEGPDRWFPERGESTSEAKAVCARCPVRQQCLDHQLDHGAGSTDVGVWGGTSARERRQIRKARNTPHAA